MLSLLKKLFAKKEDRPVAPWPFPTGTVKIETPVPEVKPVEATVGEPAKPFPASKPTNKTKPAVAAKSAPRKPRAKKAQ